MAVAGRVACEIQSADELVLTELIFNGVFSALSGEQIVALTSCFVWSEKSDVGVKVCTAHHSERGGWIDLLDYTKDFSAVCWRICG